MTHAWVTLAALLTAATPPDGPPIQALSLLPSAAVAPGLLEQIAPIGADSNEVAWQLYRSVRDRGQLHPMRGAVPDTLEPTDFGGFFNILYQKVALEVDPETGDISEIVTVELVSNKDALDPLPLTFPSNLEIGAIHTPDGEPVNYEMSVGTLLILLDPPLNQGDSVTLEIEANGTFECGGGGMKACSFGKSINYVTHAPFYVQNSTATIDLFLADLEITVPEDWVVAGTGRLVEVLTAQGAENRSSTYVFHHDFETIFISFAIAKYEVETTEQASIPITAYMTKDVFDNRSTILDLASDIVGFYESVYSTFPFLNLDVVQIHNDFGGGYGPQATIMMAADVFDIPSGSDYYGYLVQLMSHEIGHQWWGNHVMISAGNAVTLSEGLAEFSSGLHYKEEMGSGSALRNNAMSYLYTVSEESDVPLTSSLVYESGHYQTLVYDKASAVFNMLRHELGDDVFFQVIQLYIATHGNNATDIYGFFEAAAVASGRDLDWFFEQWFLDVGYPRFELDTEIFPAADGSAWFVRLVVTQDGPVPFSMSLPISITVQSNHRSLKMEPMWVEGPRSTAIYRVDEPVLRVSTDPGRVFLQKTRPKLVGDVNLSGEVDGSDIIDMAVLFHRDIVARWGGGSYFWPNGWYLPRFDINADGHIDEADLAILLEQF